MANIFTRGIRKLLGMDKLDSKVHWSWTFGNKDYLEELDNTIEDLGNQVDILKTGLKDVKKIAKKDKGAESLGIFKGIMKKVDECNDTIKEIHKIKRSLFKKNFDK
jgi:hypothetical protein